MKNLRTLQALLEDPNFTLHAAEDIFRFLVALGDEKDHGNRQWAKSWLEFEIRHMPQIFSLVPPFMQFLTERFPLPKGDEAVAQETLNLLRRAQLGAGTWNREFLRFSQLQAVMLTYEYLLRKTPNSNGVTSPEEAP